MTKAALDRPPVPLAPHHGPQARIELALEAIANGSMAILLDGRETGWLVTAGQDVSTERLASFITRTSGVVMLAVAEARAVELGLPHIDAPWASAHLTTRSVTVGLRNPIASELTVAGRAATVRALSDTTVHRSAFRYPGHLHVLRTDAGGVLARPAMPEAAVDLVRVAGRSPTALLGEVFAEDGLAPAHGEELMRIAQQHDLPLISLDDLARAVSIREPHVERAARAEIPTNWGAFTAYCHVDRLSRAEHITFVTGDLGGHAPPLIRIQRECLLGDVFAARDCPCRRDLDNAMRLLASHGDGALVYLRGKHMTGRALGIVDADRSIRSVQRGDCAASVGTDASSYDVAAQILRDLGVRSARYLGNDRDAIEALQCFHISVHDYGSGVAERGGCSA